MLLYNKYTLGSSELILGYRSFKPHIRAKTLSLYP